MIEVAAVLISICLTDFHHLDSETSCCLRMARLRLSCSGRDPRGDLDTVASRMTITTAAAAAAIGNRILHF